MSAGPGGNAIPDRDRGRGREVGRGEGWSAGEAAVPPSPRGDEALSDGSTPWGPGLGEGLGPTLPGDPAGRDRAGFLRH